MQTSIRFSGFVLGFLLACAVAFPGQATGQEPDADTYFRQGFEAHEQGDPRSAIASYSEALNLDRDHEKARFNRALAYFSLNKWMKCSDDLDHYIRLRPDDRAALEQRADAALMLKNFSDATHFYGRAIGIADGARTRTNRGLAYFEARNIEAALQDFRAALQLDSLFYEAWLGYGNAFYQIGEYENAIACYQKALQLGSDNPGLTYNIGIALFKLGQYETAIEQFNKDMSLRGPNAYALAQRAACYFNLDRFEEAEADANLASGRSPHLPEALHVIGLLQIRAERYEEAEQTFSKSLDFEPNHSELLAGRSLVRLKQRRYEEALEDAESAIAYGPTNGDAYYIRASLRKLANDKPGACDDYQKANNYGYRPLPDMDGTVFCEGLSDGLEVKKDGGEH